MLEETRARENKRKFARAREREFYITQVLDRFLRSGEEWEKGRKVRNSSRAVYPVRTFREDLRVDFALSKVTDAKVSRNTLYFVVNGDHDVAIYPFFRAERFDSLYVIQS